MLLGIFVGEVLNERWGNPPKDRQEALKQAEEALPEPPSHS